MASNRQPRLYTVDEARALVPELRRLVDELRHAKHQLEQEIAALQRLTPAMRANGSAARASRHERQISHWSGVVRDRLGRIDALDVEVKDIESGLVDFYSEREGRVVYLCWRIDEPTVAFWHELDAGFRGRQPLPE